MKILIFRPWITLKNGTRLYARTVGKRVFCFEVDKICSKKEPVIAVTDSSQENIA
jgi:hypothetical protein